ncbi:MAG: hypothetical protein AAF745_01800 [Planctomycetota bacterium]
MIDQLCFCGDVVSAIGLPAIAMVLLVASKLATSDAAPRAQRRFLIALVVMTIITARTVTTSEPTWLIHTTTLSIMIVGSLWIPDQTSWSNDSATMMPS